MRTMWNVLCVAGLIAVLAPAALAQGPEREGRRDGERGPGRPPGGPPIIAALDADRDGEISSEEIENAVAALKKLDKNGDGKLTREEMFGDFGGRGPGGRPGGFNPEQFVARILEADKDGDGKLSKDEAPERMRDRFDQIDGNKDGFIDKAEITAMMQQFGRGRGEGRPDGDRPRGGRPEGRPQSRDSDDN